MNWNFADKMDVAPFTLAINVNNNTFSAPKVLERHGQCSNYSDHLLTLVSYLKTKSECVSLAIIKFCI